MKKQAFARNNQLVYNNPVYFAAKCSIVHKIRPIRKYVLFLNNSAEALAKIYNLCCMMEALA